MGFVDWFARVWSVSEESEHADLIVPLSYGALPSGHLANGTMAALDVAVECKDSFPRALIAFGNAPNCFEGSEIIEGRLKGEFFRREGVDKDLIFDAGPALNSVLEARAVRERLDQAGIHPKCIIVIAGALHSRSVRVIWEKVFPESRIVMYTFDYRFEYQADHPEFLVRGRFRWVAANIARYLVVRLFGLRVASRITHSSKFPFTSKIS